MESVFRIAIGNYSCRSPSRRLGPQAVRICAVVERRIAHLELLERWQILSLPAEEHEIEECDGREIDVSTVREDLRGDYQLVVVIAFRPGLKWPNFISFHGIGQVYAEGIVISPDGNSFEATHELMLPYI